MKIKCLQYSKSYRSYVQIEMCTLLLKYNITMKINSKMNIK